MCACVDVGLRYARAFAFARGAVHKTDATWLKTAPLTFALNLSDVRLRSESGGVKQLDLDGTLTFDVPAAPGSLAGTATGTVTVQLTF